MSKQPKWKLISVKYSDIKENPNNAKIPDERGFKRLKKLTDKFGIIFDGVCNKDLTLADGHQRRKLHKPDDMVNVFVPDRQLTDAEFTEVASLFDNVAAGSMDWSKLKENFENFDLNIEDWDLNIPDYSAGHEANNMTDNDVDITEDFDPVGITKDCQRVVFIFENKEAAESYLKAKNIDFVKRNMAWQVNMNTLSI